MIDLRFAELRHEQAVMEAETCAYQPACAVRDAVERSEGDLEGTRSEASQHSVQQQEHIQWCTHLQQLSIREIDA